MSFDGLRPAQRSAELSISQAATRLGVSVASVRRWADAGHLASYRTLSGHRRFSVAEIEAFVANLARR